ncbi:hypothetical protein SDC9_84012 [bioreactor metagenome]|uniref:Uncharacterized protein n=1 Tax=bioreactor metagenome TaxID=1076179 RepID=A0A644ZAS8_9ZZZZ
MIGHAEMKVNHVSVFASQIANGRFHVFQRFFGIPAVGVEQTNAKAVGIIRVFAVNTQKLRIERKCIAVFLLGKQPVGFCFHLFIIAGSLRQR